MEQWLKDKVEWYKNDEWLRTAEFYKLFRKHLFSRESSRKLRAKLSFFSRKIEFYSKNGSVASIRHISRKNLLDAWLSLYSSELPNYLKMEIANRVMWKEVKETQTVIGGFSAAIYRPRVTRHRRAKRKDPKTVA